MYIKSEVVIILERKNVPDLCSLLKSLELVDVKKICQTSWSTKLGPGRECSYENIFYRAYSNADKIYYFIIVGRSSRNEDWNVVLRIINRLVIEIDKQNGLVAWSKDRGTAVTNGHQNIGCIEYKIPKSIPAKLKEFATEILNQS